MIWNSLQERSVSWLEVARGGTFAEVLLLFAKVARGKLSDGELMAVHFEDLMVRSKLMDSIAIGAPARSSGGGAIH